MTHLSVKALRYYHDVGLLEPAGIDCDSGYRLYELSQVGTAQVIRRFRDLGMPIEHIKAILSASEVDERNRLIVYHLKQMESDLERTQNIVASLRKLLEEPVSAIAIEYRSVPALRVAAVSCEVEVADLGTWWADSFEQIDRAMRRQQVVADGPRGGIFPTELFTEEFGEVTVFVPISESMSPEGSVILRELPAADLAIALHRGSLGEADHTFGTLGAHVLEKTIAIEGPIREHYLVTAGDTDNEAQFLTEIGWPIFRTATGGSASS